MKGVVRQMDHLGRVVIPKEMRDSLNMKEGDPIDIYLQKSSICIEKCKQHCTICGSMIEDKLVEVEGVHICKECIKKVVQISKEGVKSEQ
ncbi:AbrB/MazE/SpoVT family DNA-binding domain-containing protein [Lachnotalea glycerini]|uniref:AbrB/MazE/SpoVT family DNA-binding domain-containing protein n=1 Tax=Lachnotalea glycerini TaxID=1763509 RepID=A0A371JBN5_9FIRM|nr:AbrB/MazE/SpoVT family DNA-binding domain-containing protein [Lachnotalea glycerini]RDY30164.1 AbrB/MazE/SpoVT family DNA-binding domain-containing protein [Lachnotalea glycerini]